MITTPVINPAPFRAESMPAAKSSASQEISGSERYGASRAYLEFARERLRIISAIGAHSVHIDVSDGVFSPVNIGGTPADLQKLLAEFPGVAAHVHLMVAEPEAVLEQWIGAGAKRVIVHIEAVPKGLGGIINYTTGPDVFLGLKKETPAESLSDLLRGSAIKGVHLLAVPIGYSGGQFDEAILRKIKYIKEKAPHLMVCIDGGVNPEVASMVKAAGADEVVSSTYIFGSPDPKKAYEELIAL